MSKAQAVFVCQSCGMTHTKWAGQCSGCLTWNTLVQETFSTPPGGLKPETSKISRLTKLNFETLDTQDEAPARMVTGIEEFDRVCGGGVVPGSAILLAGDPGVGKSTLLLQVTARAAMNGLRVAYISGEEAVEQIRGRALRMGVTKAPVDLAAETSLRTILDALKRDKYDLVVVDSIQTLWSDAIDAAQGSVSQVRACAGELVRLAKKTRTAMILVGHVTKEGQIAGPRVVEHMVDAVLSFEGERGYPFRILRGSKNRFGATDEIGVFEMGDGGLREVPNPSALFLGDNDERSSGSAVFAGIEGSRPVLVEIQALVAPSALGTPRRAVVGWDSGRLAMILAVLESRCGLGFGGKDVYLNVAGGLKINEPAADLAAAMALVSALLDQPLPKASVIFGEISLSGEVRGVSRMEARMKEALKLGFSNAIAPSTALENAPFEVKAYSHLVNAMGAFDMNG
ncbi:DNA repair protein RadA [Asticcacaulis sp. BYS171W]|uniref:DNA repair protein RadA n=1 Tax=Asticcacaulis aquaticus TaxID=2984212 RepID=A0ABT5HRD1_9CAUL|nr:DNA repair protein RadA [Asticcacaulis aquaticus]MDC7682011.1 DNA repair protein RadA [Asticcacaulis aquaticus]